MPTTGSGLFPYPNASAVPDVPADILLLAQKIDLIASGWTLTADATTRAALVTNGFAYEGLHVYQIDTKVLYIYQASAWVAQTTRQGLNPIIPTSVAVGGGTGTVGANGVVTLTAATTSASINGITGYANYRLIGNVTGSTSTITARLRTSAPADDSNAVYDVSPTATAGTSWAVGVAATSHKWALDIFDLNPAAATTISPIIHDYNFAAGTASTVTAGLGHRNSTAFAGLTFLTTAAITGTIRIYGYNDN